MLQPRFQRILIVDDEEDTRVMVAWVFRDLGYEVDLAGDGWEALNKIEEERPDLVILDLVLPGIDGWTLLQQLRSMEAPPPAVIMTACGDSGSFACAVREGAAGFVFKPFRVTELISICESILLRGARVASACEERRQAPRRLLALGLQARGQDRVTAGPGKLIDLSLGGAQLDLPAPLEPGDRVSVAFQIPDREAPFFELEGRVRWRTPAQPDYAHGVAFENLPPEIHRRLQDLLTLEAPIQAH